MKDNHVRSMTDQQLQALLRETLPLQDALVIGMVPPNRLVARIFALLLPKAISVMWIDTSKMANFRDLGRVHAAEGKGEVVCTWTYIDEALLESYFVLAVEMQSPVRTSFRITIHLPEYAALMEIVSWTGSLTLVSGPPIEWRQLLYQMPVESLMSRIYEQGGDDITLTMSKETTAELRRHFETWKRLNTPRMESLQP